MQNMLVVNAEGPETRVAVVEEGSLAEFFVERKRDRGMVGNKAVQEVISAVSFYGGDEGWVITNSSFTPSAIALAQIAPSRPSASARNSLTGGTGA